MNAQANNIKTLIRQKISQIDPQAEAILYGSRVRGNARVDSDWDILILTSYPVTVSTERLFRDHLYDIEMETGEPISVFVFSKADWNTRQKITPFYRNVIREGVTL